MTPKQRLVDVQYNVSVEVASSSGAEPASFVDLVLHHEDRSGATGKPQDPLRLELSLAEFAQLKKAVDAVDALVRGSSE